MNLGAFLPYGTVTISATSSTSTVALVGSGTAVEVQNDGTVAMFVKLGGASVTAAITDYPILAGNSKLISRDVTQTHIAAITAATAATGYATTGDGN